MYSRTHYNNHFNRNNKPWKLHFNSFPIFEVINPQEIKFPMAPKSEILFQSVY